MNISFYVQWKAARYYFPPPPILWKKSRNTAAVKSQSGHWLSVPFSWHVIFVAYWSVTLYFQLFYKYIPRSQITCTENQGRRLCAEELTSLTFPLRVFMEAEVEPSSSAQRSEQLSSVSPSPFHFSVAYLILDLSTCASSEVGGSYIVCLDIHIRLCSCLRNVWISTSDDKERIMFYMEVKVSYTSLEWLTLQLECCSLIYVCGLYRFIGEFGHYLGACTSLVCRRVHSRTALSHKVQDVYITG